MQCCIKLSGNQIISKRYCDVIKLLGVFIFFINTRKFKVCNIVSIKLSGNQIISKRYCDVIKLLGVFIFFINTRRFKVCNVVLNCWATK